MDQRTRVLICRAEPLDLAECYNFVRSPKCGAINLFSGTIRDHDCAAARPGARPAQEPQALEPITGIYYEAYPDMLAKQIPKMVLECHLAALEGACEHEDDNGGHHHNQQQQKQQYHHNDDGNARACVAVRLGHVPVGEPSVIICASSTRRDHSRRLVKLLLARIKAEAVIWKKVIFADGKQLWDCELKSEARWLRRA